MEINLNLISFIVPRQVKIELFKKKNSYNFEDIIFLTQYSILQNCLASGP